MRRCPTCETEHSDDIRYCPHDGTALAQAGTEADDPFIGRMLSRWAILSKLGEGGMGRVYMARHRTLERVDAVKVLKLQVADTDAGRRFLREAKLATKVRHPNAVLIYDFDWIDNFGQPESSLMFLVMEYIEGQSLRELLKKEGHLSPARVVNIIQQVAAALDAAHQLGVIHRDLKPENIMVMDGDRVKVVDFGIAKAIGGQEGFGTITRDGRLVGTPYYMSPEQALGKPLDGRSDVYSLGLVAYEMLTGVCAFDRTRSQIVVRQVEPPRQMSVAAPQVTVPVSVEAVVRQALAQRPADRPPSAGGFAVRLEKALAFTGGDKLPPVMAQLLPTSAYDVVLDAEGVAAALRQSGLLCKDGDYESALRVLDEALAKNPISTELRIEKARVLLMRIRLEEGDQEEKIVRAFEAIELVCEVLDSNPNYGPAYLCLGMFMKYLGNLTEAIISYKFCLDLNSGQEYAYDARKELILIYNYLLLNNSVQPTFLLDTTISNAIRMEAQVAIATAAWKSQEFFPRYILARFFIAHNQYALAREQIEKLLQNNAFPDEKLQASIYYELAQIASFEKKYTEAVEAAERAAQLDPQNGDYQKLAQELRQYHH